jgi:DNA-binding response OmpR family regulator
MMRKAIRSILNALRGVFGPEMTAAELERTLSPRPGPPGKITIVALLAEESDRELLSRLAFEQQWTLHWATACGDCWNLVRQTRAQIVLCDRGLVGAPWREVLQMIASARQPVYAVLVSKVADDYLWNEVIRWGGHDLLTAPLRKEEVLRAIRFGWSFRNSSIKATRLLANQNHG